MPSEKRLRQRQNSQARAVATAAARRRQDQRRRLTFILPIVVIVGGLLAFLVVQSGSKSKVTSTTPTSVTPTTGLAVASGAKITGDTPCPAADGSSPRTTSFAKPPPLCITASKHYVATMTTDQGALTISLDPVKSPLTANNFVVLARYHFFDGVVFHRVVPGFVVQGGDPTGTGSGGPGYQFADELPATGAYKVGSLAMANSGKNTNGSQFFIIVGAQGAALPPNYSLFGMVTQGIDVAHKIEADGAQDPNPPKVIHKILTVTITES